MTKLSADTGYCWYVTRSPLLSAHEDFPWNMYEKILIPVYILTKLSQLGEKRIINELYKGAPKPLSLSKIIRKYRYYRNMNLKRLNVYVYTKCFSPVLLFNEIFYIMMWITNWSVYWCLPEHIMDRHKVMRFLKVWIPSVSSGGTLIPFHYKILNHKHLQLEIVFKDHK